MSLQLSYIFGVSEPKDFRDTIKNQNLIIPEKGFDWKTLQEPNRLSKVFRFKTNEALVGFVGACLKYETEHHHQGRITIQNPVVKVEIWTKGIMDITEMDIEYAREVNEIYKDWENA